MSVLVARGLAKSFRGRRVVDGVSFEVHPGEVVGLLGPNGAGKTTSFHCVVGLLVPDEGEVLLGGKDLSGLPLHRRARMGLGYLPQEDSIFRKLSVRDNLLLVLEGHGVKGQKARDKADEVLTEFELLRVADSLGDTLSGGERRRAEIARSLVSEPRFLLFDEPFAGIDPISIADIRELVRELRSRDIGVLITDHNVRETLDIVDSACIIYDGQVLFAGTPEALVADQEVRRLYLGESFAL